MVRPSLAKTFVQNRVNEVRKLVPENQWRHCPGKTNPADMPLRGTTLSELIDGSVWVNGPEWLLQEDMGQSLPLDSEVPEECAVELQTQELVATYSLISTEGAKVSNLIAIERYGSMGNLLRVTTHIIRFVEILKKSDNLTPVGLYRRAEALWISEAQSHIVWDERGREWKRQLGLFQDSHGLWRCGGRLGNADLSYDAKHPMLLPNEHPFTTLVVKWAHTRVLHNGTKETLTEVRN